MAQRTRTTTARVAWAGAALILGAGLTGCMNDGKKSTQTKAVGPGPNQTLMRTGQPGYPAGTGQYQQAATGQGANPGAGMGSAAPGTNSFTPASGTSQPGMGGATTFPVRQTTGTNAPAGAPMPGVPQMGTSPGYNYPGGSPGAVNTPGASGSNYPPTAHGQEPTADLTGGSLLPPSPPGGIPQVTPHYEVTPPTPSAPTGGPLAPSSPFGSR